MKFTGTVAVLALLCAATTYAAATGGVGAKSAPEPAPKAAESDPRCPVNCGYSSVECECAKFYQCREGEYTEYVCPDGLHFNKDTLQCDTKESAGCNLNPGACCECEYLATGDCKAEYIFKDFNRDVSYEGSDQCVSADRKCDNGLVWNSAANDAGGSCDFTSNTAGCPTH